MACQVQVAVRLFYLTIYLLFRKVAFVHDTQFTLYLRLVSDCTGPFFRSLESGKMQCL